MRKFALSAAVAALATLSAASTTTSADAAVTRPAQPIRIVVAGPTVKFTATVKTTSTLAGWHHAAVYAPQNDTLAQVGAGASKTATVAVRTRLASRWLTPGQTNELVAEDRTDGGWGTIALDVRRASRLGLTHADPAAGGTVKVRGLLRHYSIPADRYVGSNRSPVRVQQLVAGRWTTIGTWTTNRSGLGGTTVRPMPGRVVLRLVRPEGATVTAATSNRVEVDR